MLTDRRLDELRVRLTAHADTAEDDPQILPILAGVHLAGNNEFAALGMLLWDVHQGPHYRATVELVVATCYGRARPNPALVVTLPPGSGGTRRDASSPEVLAVRVFAAIAGGDPDAAWAVLRDADPVVQSYRERMVLGLLLRWLYAQAEAGFPPDGPGPAWPMPDSTLP